MKIKSINEIDELYKSYIISKFKSYTNEGLITSFSYSKMEDVLFTLAYKYPVFNDVRIQIKNEFLSFNCELKKSIKIDDKKKFYTELISLLNVSGYYISNWKYDDSEIQITNLDLNNFLKIKENITIYLNKRYDYLNNDINVFLYHVTESAKLNKILKNGLIPKSYSVIENHPDRIYLFDNLEMCYKYIEEKEDIHFSKSEIKNFTILKIDVRLLKKIKLYKDPKFYQNAFYTYDNISPKSIVEYFNMGNDV